MTRPRNTMTWSHGLLESVPYCPACKSPNRDSKVIIRRDNDGVFPEKWTMVSCSDCGSLYLDPRPDAASLPRAYSDYYTHNAANEQTSVKNRLGFVWSLVNGYLNHRFRMRRRPANRLGYLAFCLVEPLRLKLEYYGRHLSRAQFPRAGRLLDIGCGNGSFLLRAREMGWEVLGCDPDPHAAEICQSLGLNVCVGNAFSTSYDHSSFDVVTMSHVIEHVSDPRRLLERAYSLLRPGGHIWLAWPNIHGIGFRMFGTAWFCLHVPFHLCIPSGNIASDLLRAVGFRQIRFLRRGMDIPAYWENSRRIALDERINAKGKIAVKCGRLLSNVLATFSSRWSEELILIARKPTDG